MFGRFASACLHFFRHPVTKLVTGLLLVWSASTELVDDFEKGWDQFTVGVHHGVALMGVVQVMTALAEVFERLEHVELAKLRKRE
jgi:hypothetical protein